MKKVNTQKGITLVALIITIIVLLILAVVSIQAVTEDGIIAHAKNARTEYEQAQENEQALLNTYLGYLNNEVGVTGGDSVEVTINGEKVTQENARNYLGKVVTNYTGKSSVAIGGTTYIVSPTYRLYYIDFAGYYGEEGTIYLKAECTGNNYSLPVTDTTEATVDNIKIKALNPKLYNGGNTGPSTSNNNMKAVTWLTNTNNWSALGDTSMQSYINYIVGAPSVEMMMDSYNFYYNLTGDTPDYSDITAGERRKLFSQYTQGDSGYKVGPNADEGVEYGNYTSDNSVYTDSEIDTMYYPGANQYYWLASPSAGGSDRVMYVASGCGGYVNRGSYSNYYALCPLVSLKSTVNLTVE